ncbi:MAG: YggS family pyridoxal phosphate-dependent enzyme [Pseudobdellovibrionaceae bacterium]
MNEDHFRQYLEKAANAALVGEKNRPQKKWQIVAVSKLQLADKIQRLHSWGHIAFGENYVQELINKIEFINNPSIQWHFIGHLQKNKVKYLVKQVDLIHSVDSLALAETIDKKSKEKNHKQKILLQVNLAGENSKSGFDKNQLLTEWPVLQKLANVQIQGLMTMPPLFEEPQQNRPFFVELRTLLADLKSTLQNDQHSMTELSMGTSQDALIALEEGSTMIRVGTALFGERPQH